MRIIYTRPEDGGLSFVSASPKERIEQILGPLTDDEYKQHVFSVSIPLNAINPVEVDSTTIPSTMEFFDAWEQDVEPEKIIINLTKALTVQLSRLRDKREPLLQKYDGLLARAQEIGSPEEIDRIKAIKQQLRDITNPLKNLVPQSIEDIINATPSLDAY